MNDPDATLPPEAIEVDQIASGQPQHIGRYRVERVLGVGRLGLVYLAHDDQLQRLAAIKVPDRKLVSRHEDVAAYLNEVRNIVSLDHPHIIPVCEVSSTDLFPCFVVSKYIEGSNLRKSSWTENPTPIQSSRIIVQLAEALDYAHQRNLHHLHLTPNQIVLDAKGKPFLKGTDFMRLERLAGEIWSPGNPSYLSPEQVAGEHKLIGAASDIFSLGLVFYEMLTGRLPYRSQSFSDLCKEIVHGSLVPPSRVKEGIASELDKICVIALAKSPAARYRRMNDFAEAIRRAVSC